MEILATLITAAFLIWLIVTVAACHRAMPRGLAMASPLLPAAHLIFLTDLTYLKEGKLICEQHILAEMLRLIREAKSFIILDIFLYNDLHDPDTTFPPLSREVTHALLAAKKQRPALSIWLISDPANTGYNSYPNPYFQELEAAGAIVVVTNLNPLPDSNLFYAGFSRLLCWPLAGKGRGWLPSPFYPRAPLFRLQGWLALFNFKANHRKLVFTEQAALITSANNSHDASAANSNIAFGFTGPLLAEVLKSEEAVTALSGLKLAVDLPRPAAGRDDGTRIQLLTEGKIKEVLLADLQECRPPATLWLAMFYLSDQQIITALLAAAERGITVNLILDANCQAFGRRKNGVPNRPVAAWLTKKSNGRIHIRWYASHEEQFHTKLIMLVAPERWMILGGSANLTRRNIANFNLESCLRILSPAENTLNQQVLSYFQRLWNNVDGEFTVDYEVFADTSILKYWQYQLQERTGVSLF